MPVVKDVSFTVGPGEVLVLLGTSGSGKTTTLKMINKLVERDGGKIVIQGEDTDTLTPFELRRRIGYVIQSIGLFPHYSIAQNIAIVPELLGWDKGKVRDRVHQLLEMMNLPAELLSRRPHQLSGGQQQRVGIARALAGDPPLILMDEPFGALDPITRQELQNEFKKLEGGLNKAIVLVTHDIMEAVSLGDRICILHHGEVQQIGTPRELIFRPANAFVTEFLGQHRLQLEMSVVLLRHLTPFLETSTAPASGEKRVTGDMSLSDMLMLEGKSSVFFEWEGQGYHAYPNDVPKLYFDHRQTIIEHLNGAA